MAPFESAQVQSIYELTGTEVILGLGYIYNTDLLVEIIRCWDADSPSLGRG